MILRGPGAGNLGDYNPADVRVYDEIGRRGEKILPGYKYIIIAKDLYTVYGGTVDSLRKPAGRSLSPTSWTSISSRRSGSKTRERGRRGAEPVLFPRTVQGGHDPSRPSVHGRALHAPWKPYIHPVYGEIEIGGVKKFEERVLSPLQVGRNLPPERGFCAVSRLRNAGRGLRGSLRQDALDGGLFQVDFAVTDAKATPTMSAQAASRKLHRPDQSGSAARRRSLWPSAKCGTVS